MKNTPNAVTSVGRITACRCPARPSLAIIMYSGMMPICIGTIIVAMQKPEQQVAAAEPQLREGETGQRAERDGAQGDRARRRSAS